MEKRTYVKPILSGEEFIPQNYIAACGDSGTVYKFTCDAGGGASGDVWIENNGVEGLQEESDFVNGKWVWADRSLGGYHACSTSHEAESTNNFYNGYYRENGSSTVVNVIVWRGPYNNNTHCTEELDMNKWETAKS